MTRLWRHVANAKKIFALRRSATNFPDQLCVRPENAARIGRGSKFSTDDDDVQSAGPVGAEQQGLLNVGGARGTGDEIEGAWRAALAIGAAQLGERALI